MALTPAEVAFVATHEPPVVTAMKPYLNDSREAFLATAPRCTVLPVVSGAGTVGAVHSCTTGTWVNSPTFTYQWRRSGLNIAGATAATYTAVTADAGLRLTCVVTGTNATAAVAVASANGINIPAVDNVAPVPVAFSPADNAYGVAVGVNLVVTFSETVTLGTGVVTLKKVSDNSTVTSWNVATQAGSGAGQVNVVGGTQLTLRPSVALANTTDFYVIWDANVVKDAANNPVAALTNPSVWDFTTVVVLGPDVTPPTATIFNPADNTASVSITTDLVATMSETVVLGASGTIDLKKTSDNSVIESWNVATEAGSTAGKVNVVGGNLLTMRLTAPLANSIEYYVTWTAGVVQDTSANPIAAQAVTTLWSFTTAAAGDVTPPTVVSFNPLDDATGVALTANLVATMSETVTLGASGVITLKKTSDNSTVDSWNVATASGSTAGKVEVVGGTQLTMHLTASLPNSLGVYVIWDAGVVKDAANNPIAAQASTTVWSFTTVAAGGTALLDLYPTASMAYSFRRLRTAYAGSAVRIRRSSDNAEANIGFDGSGNFDSAAASAHIGGGTGFIVTWFDQSGNGIDVTNAIAANQPDYSATGMNSKPAMVYAVNDGLIKTSVANTALPATTTTTMSVILEDGTNATGNAVFSWTVTAANTFNVYGAYSDAIYFDFSSTNPSPAGRISVAQPSGWNTGGHLLETGREVGNAQFITVDGVELVRITGYTGVLGAATASFHTGRSAASDFFSGLQSEIVIWAADLAANRSAARANITAYWLPAASTLLLDVLGVSATRAYSTRKLRSAYAGSAIRIRRSSDNAEQDIGFSGEDLDTAAITAFVGANSAYVVKMYDQSGSAIDMVQATVATQPRIVNVGVLDVRNGKAAAYFDGTDDELDAASVTYTAKTIGAIAAIDSASPFPHAVGLISGGSTTMLIVGQNANIVYYGSGSLGVLNVNNAGNILTWSGTLHEARASSATGVTPTDVLKIGRDRTAAAFWIGWVGEAVIFDTQLSAPNYATLYDNQKAYWQTGLLLDTLGVTATRAYSTRKLRAAYAGSAIRIRRSSDNAEQDIGFVGENLDTAAITTFVGANSAFVVTMYDQSGSAADVTQATVAAQPRIVNAGVLDVRNTKAAPYFDGTDDRLAAAAVAWTAKTIGAAAAVDSASPFPHAVGIVSSPSIILIAGQSAATIYYPSGSTGTPIVDNTANVTVFGGVLQNVRTSSATGASASDTLQVGRDRSTSQNWLGWIGEVVLFDPQLSAGNYTALYTNQKTYWGTP